MQIFFDYLYFFCFVAIYSPLWIKYIESTVVVYYNEMSNILLLIQRFKPFDDFHSPFFLAWCFVEIKLTDFAVLHKIWIKYIYIALAATHYTLKLRLANTIFIYCFFA
jgi:hypothetical protein